MIDIAEPQALLLEIARCPVIAEQRAEPHPHPCATIIGVQSSESISEFQVPEPWSGDLAQAPILFLSSNPSISEDERYPRAAWRDERIADFFLHRFGGGREHWTEDGLRLLRENGTPRKEWVRFWASVRARATELLERDPVPGKDYVLSEVVHCKSEAERGVWDAVNFCADRYLVRTVNFSAAAVIVVLGTIAANQVRRVLNLTAGENFHGPVPVAGRDRYIAFLPHANVHRPRSLAACLSPDELQRVRARLQHNRAVP